MNTPTLTEAVEFFARYHPATGARAELELMELQKQSAKPSRKVLEVGEYSRRCTLTPKHKAEKGALPIPAVIVERK